MNTAIAALMSAAALVWSYTSFPIPNGLGFLHLVNAAAVGSGYLSGFEIKRLKVSAGTTIAVSVIAGAICLIGAIAYAYLVWKADGGFANAVKIVASSFAFCFSLSALVGLLVSKDVLKTE